MAFVKSFRVHPEYGIPDRDIREFLNLCEKDGTVQVNIVYVPGFPSGRRPVDPRLTVIVTKFSKRHMSFAQFWNAFKLWSKSLWTAPSVEEPAANPSQQKSICIPRIGTHSDGSNFTPPLRTSVRN